MSCDFGQGGIRSECGRIHGKFGKKNVKQLLRLEAYGKRRVAREVLAEQASPRWDMPGKSFDATPRRTPCWVEVRAWSLGTFSRLSDSGDQK